MSDSMCFVHTKFLSGVVVVFSKVLSKEHCNAVNHLIQSNSLECVTLLVWCGVSLSELDGLNERHKVMFFGDDSSFKTLLDLALAQQVQQEGTGENLWVLDDETSNERFLVSLGLSSLVSQFMLATLSLGQILTLAPTAICRRTGTPSLGQPEVLQGHKMHI